MSFEVGSSTTITGPEGWLQTKGSTQSPVPHSWRPASPMPLNGFSATSVTRQMPEPKPTAGLGASPASPGANRNAPASPAHPALPLGKVPPFPVPGELMMFEKQPQHDEMRRFLDLQRQVEYPLLQYIHKSKNKKDGFSPTAIRPVMLGTNFDEAKVWMIVLCDKRLIRRAKKYFKELAQTSVEILVTRSPWPVARVLAQLPISPGTDYIDEERPCGQPMTFFNPDTSVLRNVTLGGILRVCYPDGSAKFFGMTVAHAIDEVESKSPVSATSTSDYDVVASDSDTDNLSSTQSPSDDVSPTTTALSALDLRESEPRKQERISPWDSGSIMVPPITPANLMDAADEEIGEFYDWALVPVSGGANKTNTYSRSENGKMHERALKLPTSRTLQGLGGTQVILLSSEGPKAGRIGPLPARLQLHPGKAFIDTHMIKLNAPYTIAHGDSGSWVIDERTLEVYGHLIAVDALGDGYVVLLQDVITDMMQRLGAESIDFPQPEALQLKGVKVNDDPKARPEDNRTDSISGDGSKDSISSDGGKKGEQFSQNAKIRYIQQYRNAESGHLLDSKRMPGPSEQRPTGNNTLTGVVFDVIKTYMGTGLQAKTTRCTTSLYLHSAPIKHALQSVVQYYPRYNLGGNVISWPYVNLVHHYEELKGYANRCALKVESDSCLMNRNVPEHVGLLLEFLDREIMDAIRLEKERNDRQQYTFDLAWLALRPGATILWQGDSRSDSIPGVVSYVKGGTHESLGAPWTIKFWNLEYDGEYLGRVLHTVTIDRFEGEKEMPFEVVVESPSSTPSSVKLASRAITGGAYWEFARTRQYQSYCGHTAEFPFKEVKGNVMVDLKTYFSIAKKPGLMGTADCRGRSPGCGCEHCRKQAEHLTVPAMPMFEDYNYIKPNSRSRLTEHQYFLCPSEIWVYVFQTKTWAKVYISNLVKPNWREDVIDNLVMNEHRKNTLVSLTRRHIREDRRDQRKALAILLHGRSGVGKTFTAECLSSNAQRPLIVLTASDLVLANSYQSEQALIRNFGLARDWGAFVLIEEADMLLQRHHAAQNSLGAGLTRALELYNGVVFLTTNRVDMFDDAVLSWINVKLYFPGFSDEERDKVWDFVLSDLPQKYKQDRGKTLKISNNAFKFARGPEISSLRWHGREMKNALETAVGIAEDQADLNREEQVVLERHHLRAAVNLSAGFDDYLRALYLPDERPPLPSRFAMDSAMPSKGLPPPSKY
ncbi:hypothetical protein F4778DRAFT_578486 [Xylariomycetidae sp. FL2044]|nr:hypothetical protein F4778DRAFT_578486 [Xylariomycetidae sp. FL2044]